MGQSRRTWSVAVDVLIGLTGIQEDWFVECSHRFPSFGRFEWVSGLFWAKIGCFGAQDAQFWEVTSRLDAPASGRHR